MNIYKIEQAAKKKQKKKMKKKKKKKKLMLKMQKKILPSNGQLYHIPTVKLLE